MAKKSKTQKAKASANRAAKKAAALDAANAAPVVEEAPKRGLFNFGKKKNAEESKPEPKKAKKEEKPKKRRFQFLHNVRAEMRRVTWPGKQEVLQWTGVVILALLFFGVFVVVLDDWIVTPILFAISGLGA